MTRTAVVCRYTPTPELCNASDARLNPYREGGVRSAVRESAVEELLCSTTITICTSLPLPICRLLSPPTMYRPNNQSLGKSTRR